jgi:hypothetical protein
MTRRRFALNLTADSLRWMSIVETAALHARLRRSAHFFGSDSRAKELSVRQGSSMQIRCFMILETSDAREASNVPSIRTRRFYSRDDFFI